MLPKDAVVIEEVLSSRAGRALLIRSAIRRASRRCAAAASAGACRRHVGAKLALPDRPVVALIGDGSAMYTVQALWTAAHYKLPVIWVIFNNTSYRILKQRLLAFHGDDNYVGMDFVDPPVDFAGIAKALGCEAIKYP